MKYLSHLPPCILVIAFLSGCPWSRPGDETEGEVEGEAVMEGEATPEGEMILPQEGENGVIEGERTEGETVTEGEENEGELAEGESGEGESLEGEGAEGEPGEGEPAEGEPSEEGEDSPTEGEGQAEFTSANVNGDQDDDYTDGDPPTDPEGDGDGGEEEPRELVEPDVIRRADNMLYILNQYRGLTIVNLDDGALLSQTPTYGYPRDLYLVGNKAYVLVSYAQEVEFADAGLFRVSYGSKLYLFNVADPENVVQQGVFSFDGDLVDSRLVGSVLYAVCSEYNWYECCAEGDVLDTAKADKTYGTTWAVSLDTGDPDNIHIADTVEFGGYGNLIQATSEAIFCVTNDYDSSTSLITYIDIDDPNGDITVRGSVSVPGYMADRFKMDAWNGVLRVVTNTWWPDRNTFVTTLDLTDPDTMAQLGQTTLESASGETLYATRFDGDRAYIVTYLTVDPLFIIDLADPTDPRVLGELTLPGWSTHIEPRGDRLLALGVDDQEGRRVMVSLFDVSDPAAPQRLDYASFGEDWSWSTAYEDVKAFSIFDDVILVPFSGWNYGSGGYDRLQFLTYSRDTLAARGFVDLQGSAVRSLAYAGAYYAVTQEQLAVIDAHDLDAPEVTSSLTLAENIVDVVPLADGWVMEAVARYDSADTLLRAAHADGAMGETVTLPVPSITATFLWNDVVVAVASGYEYQPDYRAYYRVFLVNIANPAAPALVADIPIEMQPWYGGWWWDYYGPEVDAPAKDAYYPYHPYASSEAAHLAGDYLVLRGYGDKFDLVLGGSAAGQGIALLDLAQPENIAYVGLGYDSLQGVAVGDGLVYLTTMEDRSLDPMGRPICAYYLQLLNPATLETGAPINVPGIFTHRVPESGILLFKDEQYRENGSVQTLLRSGRLEGEERFILVDSIVVPYAYGEITVEGDFAGYLGYAYPEVDAPAEGEGAEEPGEGKDAVYTGYVLGSSFVGSDGAFLENDPVNLGQVWCTLLGVKAGNAFLSVSGAAVAKLDFTVSLPVQARLLPVMGYPDKIRFGDSAAWLPLGYGGLAAFPW